MSHKNSLSRLRELGRTTILELESEAGILASAKEEIYGCIFGRDSLITALKLLRVYEKTRDPYFLGLVKKILHNLAKLQGQEVNIESGEEPGKCIHEFRPNNHEHLTGRSELPWYLYADNSMRNFDTVDATPLFLMAIHEYYRQSQDTEFIKEILPHVYAAIDWLLLYGDSDHDGFIDYRFHPDRKYGGLTTQSWMDSSESLFHEDGEPVTYPVAPVEAQAYTYVALRSWGDYFQNSYPERSRQLHVKADQMKKLFNEQFVINDNGQLSLAFALDGSHKPLTSARSSMGHCLWAVWTNSQGEKDSILNAQYIAPIVQRLMQPDLFEPQAGIRTLSNLSKQFDPVSYHNGSIWPHDTAITIAGLENFGFTKQARQIRRALLSAYIHFQTPVELFVFTEGQFQEYHTACKKQAWSAASLLAQI